MGKSYKDLSAHAAAFSYKIIDDNTEGLVKVQVGNTFYSPIDLSALILKELKIYPMRFSKYCIGLSLLETKVKNNRFKPVIHQLRKKEIIH